MPGKLGSYFKIGKRILTVSLLHAYARWLVQCGKGTTISPRASIYGGHGIKIGKHSYILAHSIIQCGPWGCDCLPSSRSYPDRLIIGDNCSIQPYVFISTCGGTIEIGNGCGINPYSVLYGYGHLKIGNDVMIATSCVLIPQNHIIVPGTGSLLESGSKGEGIIIHDNVWLGAHVVVLDGVEIGKGAVIGAGAVVTKSIPAGVIAAGVPAKVIRNR
jgi:acetyltransferase-like isoleucine patch superfamily enzyme